MNPVPFSRYEGAVDTPACRMPEAQLSASTSPRMIGELIGRLERYSQSEKERAMYPWADRFVMGYPLAPWQRQLKWSTEQMVAFITSIWMDVDLGSYLVNDQVEYFQLTGGGLVTRYLSDILLDGQQRLTALEEYLYNAFPVPDAQGQPCYWRDLSRRERRFFTSKIFSQSHVRSWDEKQLRLVYNLRAYGGVPHTAEERA